MGVTPQGIVYPDPSALPQRAALQTLAESVDAAITPEVETVASLGLTVDPLWTVAWFAAAKIGVQRMIQTRLIWGGATLTGGVGAALADTLVFSDLPTDWRPGSAAVFLHSRGVGATHGAGHVTTDGRIILGTLAQGGTISNGDPVGINIAYLGAL